MCCEENFPDWYETIVPDLDSELVEVRWNGVVSAAEGCLKDLSNMKTCAALFHSSSSECCSQEQLTIFRGYFREHDKAFRVKRNHRELALLAGIVLRQVSESTSDYDIALLADSLVAVPSYGRQLESAAEEICALASGDRMKRIVGLRQDKRQEPAVTLADVYKKIQEAEEGEEDKNKVAGKLKRLSTGDPIQRLTNAVIQLSRQNRLVREESDILWWLFAGACRKTGESYSDMNSSSCLLSIVRDYVDIVRIMPGPASGDAILKRQVDNAVTTQDITADVLLNFEAVLVQDIVDEVVGSCSNVIEILPIVSLFKKVSQRVFSENNFEGTMGSTSVSLSEFTTQLASELLLIKQLELIVED